MRRFLLLSLAVTGALPVSAYAASEIYRIDPAHSEVRFTIRHLVSKVAGRFDAFKGEITLDPNDPSTMKIQATIDAASIDTNVDMRDNDLRSDHFFDVEKYPEITYVSKKVIKNGDDWTVIGDLTMHGVTKEVPLEVEVVGFMTDQRGTKRAGFEATGKIDRKDFGITWNEVFDAGGTLLGDQVDITIHIEAKSVETSTSK